MTQNTVGKLRIPFQTNDREYRGYFILSDTVMGFFCQGRDVSQASLSGFRVQELKRDEQGIQVYNLFIGRTKKNITCLNATFRINCLCILHSPHFSFFRPVLGLYDSITINYLMTPNTVPDGKDIAVGFISSM